MLVLAATLFLFAKQARGMQNMFDVLGSSPFCRASPKQWEIQASKIEGLTDIRTKLYMPVASRHVSNSLSMALLQASLRRI